MIACRASYLYACALQALSGEQREREQRSTRGEYFLESVRGFGN